MDNRATDDPLNALRAQIARKYLGHAGIHGVGASAAKGAIRLYLQPTGEPGQKAVLDAIVREAAPYAVLFVEEAPAKLAGPASLAKGQSSAAPPAASPAEPAKGASNSRRSTRRGPQK